MALWVVASPHSRGLADCVGLRGFWPRFWRGGLLKMDIKSDKITWMGTSEPPAIKSSHQAAQSVVAAAQPTHTPPQAAAQVAPQGG